ncbi:MAG TPA: hypothetical protein VKM55_08165 [Candidatus Lokiarchaeia archaeon]|nr:hypothetical protein [Candidatus Lokiarchaeia archaeon]
MDLPGYRLPGKFTGMHDKSAKYTVQAIISTVHGHYQFVSKGNGFLSLQKKDKNTKHVLMEPLN